MKIMLKNGKQKELILRAKGELKWRELAEELEINRFFLSGDLKREKILLNYQIYQKLCDLSDVNYDKFIIKRLNDNWGKVRGGKNSQGSILQITTPDYCWELAEFIGAVLGDGNVNYYKKGKKIRVYQVSITGNYNLDKEYHSIYLKDLCKKLFNLEAKTILFSKKNGRRIILSSRKLIEFLLKIGLKKGDKIKSQVTIPKWIWKEEKWIRACLRGLIDTDGCIHRMSKQDPNLLRINFTNYNKTLLNDARKAFIHLGFHPTKIIREKQFFLSRKEDISKYLKEVGFSNKKHKDRYANFIAS